MGCVFCASTGLGLIRDLTPGEFTGQVFAVERDLGIRITNITIMGIGEPLDNYSNLMDFISVICDKRGRDTSARNITVSTCGLPGRIHELADTGVKINLALSLHSADDAKRAKLMPTAKKHSVDELIKAMGYYFEKTGRRPTYEYTLIKNMNDSVNDAMLLAKKLKGTVCHVNLIMLTSTGHGEMERSEQRTVLEFSNVLNKNGIEVTIRRRLGEDINAACGQLRRSRGNK
jgi:23S rRNA (adenine2503-C2)-methyltransferase